VIHGTELVAKLVEEGRVKLTEKVAKTVTFHDACYLGRHNDVYDPPRAILRAIPGVALEEVGRRREAGMCCGAGGGRMWLDEKIGTRINQVRYAELDATGAETIGVACPFCMVMLGNAKTETNGHADSVDVLELAVQALPAASVAAGG